MMAFLAQADGKRLGWVTTRGITTEIQECFLSANDGISGAGRRQTSGK
jgi:hypothetical protein